MSASVQFRSESFLYRRRRIPFLVYSGGDRPPTIAEAKSGDLFSSGDVVWVKNEWGWEIGVADGKAKSRTRYPNFTDRVLDRTDDGYRWVASSTFRSRKHRILNKDHRNIHSDNDGPLVLDPGLSSGLPVQPDHQTTHPRNGSPSVLNPEISSRPSVQPGNKSLQNECLVALRKQWTNIAVGSSCTTLGLSILDALLSFPDRIPSIPTSDPRPEIFVEGQNITLNDIVSDLIAQTRCDFYDVKYDVCDETVGVSRTELIAALPSTLRPTNCTLPLQSYSVSTLASRPNSIREYNFRIPKDVGMHAVYEEDEGRPLWNSSLCLTGSLADIHLDYCGTTRLVVNIQCNQLWLLWPATPHNLAWWNKSCMRSSHKVSTVDAIKGMRGLEMLHANGPQAFILPPYHFHTVITFDTSAHASISLWGFRWSDQFRRGFKWVIDFATNYQGYNTSSEEVEKILISIQQTGLDGWMAVAETFSEQPQADELRNWVTFAAENIQSALSIIRTS